MESSLPFGRYWRLHRNRSWYEVLHGHFAFNTELNPNGVPLFMLPMTISVFGCYTVILARCIGSSRSCWTGLIRSWRATPGCGTGAVRSTAVPCRWEKPSPTPAPTTASTTASECGAQRLDLRACTSRVVVLHEFDTLPGSGRRSKRRGVAFATWHPDVLTATTANFIARTSWTSSMAAADQRLERPQLPWTQTVIAAR